jgi:hypothetical protein
MTGPEHYAEAERLLTLADRHTKGVTYAQEWTLTLNAAQVHATLALAAATAVGTVGPDLHAWPPPAMRCAKTRPVARQLSVAVLQCCIGRKTADSLERNRPLSWVGDTGIEPVTSSV